LNNFLNGHETVGYEKDEERQIADGMLCQVNGRRGLLGTERRGSGQEQAKYQKGQHPQPSGNTERRYPLSTKVERHYRPATLRGTQGRGPGKSPACHDVVPDRAFA
jgi:hypothetical protein